MSALLGLVRVIQARGSLTLGAVTLHLELICIHATLFSIIYRGVWLCRRLSSVCLHDQATCFHFAPGMLCKETEFQQALHSPGISYVWQAGARSLRPCCVLVRPVSQTPSGASGGLQAWLPPCCQLTC